MFELAVIVVIALVLLYYTFFVQKDFVKYDNYDLFSGDIVNIEYPSDKKIEDIIKIAYTIPTCNAFTIVKGDKTISVWYKSLTTPYRLKADPKVVSYSTRTDLKLRDVSKNLF